LKPPAPSPFPLDALDRLAPFLYGGRELLSSAWFRATHHPYAVAEIVTGYGLSRIGIVPIVITECALVVLYLVPQTSVLAAIVMTRLSRRRGGTLIADRDTARAAIPLVVGFRLGRPVLAGQPHPPTLFPSPVA